LQWVRRRAVTPSSTPATLDGPTGNDGSSLWCGRSRDPCTCLDRVMVGTDRLPVSMTAWSLNRARARTLRALSHSKRQLSRAHAELAQVNRQVLEATERLAAVDHSHVLEANQQLVLAALDAHAAAELAERSRRDGAESFERRTRVDADDPGVAFGQEELERVFLCRGKWSSYVPASFEVCNWPISSF